MQPRITPTARQSSPGMTIDAPPLPCWSCRQLVASDDSYPAPAPVGGCLLGSILCGECWANIDERQA